jgi:hypothetical protein
MIPRAKKTRSPGCVEGKELTGMSEEILLQKEALLKRAYMENESNAQRYQVHSRWKGD